MTGRLPALVVCPSCRTGLSVGEDGWRCDNCNVVYPVVGEIPVLTTARSTEPAHKGEQRAFFDTLGDTTWEIERPTGSPRFHAWLLAEKFRHATPDYLDIQGATVLVICGGSGMDGEFLARAGAAAITSDLALEAAQRADQRARRHRVEMASIVADAEQLPFADAAVDVVYVHDGLHHLEDPFVGLNEMCRVARFAVSVSEPAQASVTSAAVSAGIAEEVEEAGNVVARLDAHAVQMFLGAARFLRDPMRALRDVLPTPPRSANADPLAAGSLPGRYLGNASRRPVVRTMGQQARRGRRAPVSRILIWSPNYAPELIGIPPLVTDAAEWLAARGHAVDVVTAVPNYPERRTHSDFRGAIWQSATENGVRVHRSWLRVRPEERFVDKALYELSFSAFSAPRVLARLRRADVVVCVVPSLLAATIAATVCRSTRLVLWVQDLVGLAAAAVADTPAGTASIAARLERYAAARADKVVVCSPGFEAHFVRLGIDPENVETILNWVDTSAIGTEPRPHQRPSRHASSTPATSATRRASRLSQRQPRSPVSRSSSRSSAPATPSSRSRRSVCPHGRRYPRASFRPSSRAPMFTSSCNAASPRGRTCRRRSRPTSPAAVPSSLRCHSKRPRHGCSRRAAARLCSLRNERTCSQERWLSCETTPIFGGGSVPLAALTPSSTLIGSWRCEDWSVHSSTSKTLSATVITHNRRDVLSRTLPTLLDQQPPDGGYEVIVVDDGSSDGTAELLRETSNKHVLTLIRHDERMGVSAARNAALSAASGTTVLFLDDDLLCDPGLVRAHAAAHSGSAEPLIVVGRLSVDATLQPGHVHLWLDAAAQAAHARRSAGVSLRDAFVAANCSAPRELLRACGGFDESFVGAREEHDLGLRLVRAGARPSYEPTAVVREVVLKEISDLMCDARQVGRSEVRLCREYPEYRQHSPLGRVGEGLRPRLSVRRVLTGAPAAEQLLLALPARMALASRTSRGRKIAATLVGARFGVWLRRGAVEATGSWSAFVAEFGRRLPVLAYHRIGPLVSGANPALTVSPRRFARQLALLHCLGYRSIAPGDWLQWSLCAKPLPRRPILLTFDDAYADLAVHAFPAIVARGLSATLFAPSAKLGAENDWDETLLAGTHPATHRLLESVELARWKERGIEIGAHSRTHARLTELPSEALATELEGSRRELEQLLDAPVASFAYPFGAVDERVRDATATTYETAFTIEEGLNTLATDLLLLRRTTVEPEDTLADVVLRLWLGWSPLHRLRLRLERWRLRQ